MIQIQIITMMIKVSIRNEIHVQNRQIIKMVDDKEVHHQIMKTIKEVFQDQDLIIKYLFHS